MNPPPVKKRLLVVDDEPAIVSVIKTAMELEGFEVLVAHDGLEGLEKAQRELPDLIVLDIWMPKLDGFEVLRQLKEDDKTRGVPVIILTAYPSDYGALAALKAEADQYLTKPFHPEKMVGLVRRLLGIDT